MPLRRPPHDFIPALHRRHRHRHHQGNYQCSPSLGALLPHHFLSASSSSTILSCWCWCSVAGIRAFGVRQCCLGCVLCGGIDRRGLERLTGWNGLERNVESALVSIRRSVRERQAFPGFVSFCLSSQQTNQVHAAETGREEGLLCGLQGR